MKKLSAVIASSALFLALTGCAVTAPVNATGNPIGPKVGEVTTTGILGLFFFDGGDASIRTAARNGGISRISTVDMETQVGPLGLFRKYTTVVTGD